MNDMVKFVIPAEFVSNRLLPTPAELAYGYRHGWLDSAGVIEIALKVYEIRESVPEPVEEIALLLSDKVGCVPDLIDSVSEISDASEKPARTWLFLALSWVHENKLEFADPLEAVEMLYADFGHPEAVDGLVRYMPPPEGSPVGLVHVEGRWRKYLEQEQAWFKVRDE